MRSHLYCSFCYTKNEKPLPPPAVSEEEREELTRQYLEAKELLTELNRVSPKRPNRRDILPALLLAYIRDRETFTVRGFVKTEEGKRFYPQHVWRTLKHWIAAGHVEKIRRGVYRRKDVAE